MDYVKDGRIVMTLDAGGTNFVFTAIKGNKEIINPITSYSNAHNLDLCLNTIIDGFSKVKEKISGKPTAISFGFPGPADYTRGIIGDLGNLPAFRGGIALGPFLEERFNLPVFINNDADLYAYGEAIAGFLPHINNLLENAGSIKRYKNLLGITLGTGFGGGIVLDGRLLIGDNSAGGEIWLIRNKLNPNTYIEEGASIRAVRRTYAEEAGIDINDSPNPKEIFEIGIGKIKGDNEAARRTFQKLGEVIGDAIANALTLIDGLCVIGGGLSGAYPLFLPTIIDELNSTFNTPDGEKIPRMEMKAFNLEDPDELNSFITGKVKEITIPHTSKNITYDSQERIGIGVSKLGTSKATSIGAYIFALNALDMKD